MIQVKLKPINSNENPFYGLKNCLKLQQASTDTVISEFLLNKAWNEVKIRNKESRQMFFSILFSIGDVTNRQHNIFKGKKKDNGGNANREAFYIIVNWLWKNNKRQFIKFLNAKLFNEYSCYDVLFRNRVKTSGKRIVSIYHAFEDKEYRKALLEHTCRIINGLNPFNKMLIAKFLTIPRTSKRKNHNKMLPETKQVMIEKQEFLKELSERIGWETKYFKGYRSWRKLYNKDLESVLFTTGKINEFDKDEFIDWLNKLPAKARLRVKNRIFSNPKWIEFRSWIKEWENYKEQKQQEERILREKIRKGQASEEDKQKLQKISKEAEVTIGATNFKDIYSDFFRGTVDKLKLESFINKVNLPYNSLVIIDDSGSMSGAPFDFASFIASVCLYKNPDDSNLIGMFNTHSHWYSSSNLTTPFIDPKLSFYDNYLRVSSFLKSVFQGGCTRISKIPNGLKKICDLYPEILDALKTYPVWTIISDGEWNNLSSPEASINDFFKRCENYFGFRPFIVAMDIPYYNNTSYLKADRFSGIDNMIYIPANPAMIEQFLTNFNDMDTFDVYTPLLSIFRSNRYELVRKNTL